ncbi:MAG: Lactate utilization protein B [Fimbriimonadaceae bacterium]|nr:Lactate utilization protein B [Fimbriimonadaceae bacterium]
MRVEQFASNIQLTTTQSVRRAARNVVVRDPAIDKPAARIKAAVLERLPELLEQFESNAQARGCHVHWCRDAEVARSTILAICRTRAADGATIVKAKSMATEEIHLNAILEEHGYDVVETDLGEFVVQLDGDTPSHIVAPIIHKNRYDVSTAFARAGLGPTTTDPEQLAAQARSHLRSKFRNAEIGISGANFVVAETGRIVLVENEGNNRLSTTAPKTHIALVGIEKVLATESELATMLRWLARSATRQTITTYVHFIAGPRRADEIDGPEEVHVILLDNGRSRIYQGEHRAVLRCIRCGACLNVCPVYRQASGHAYGHVYSGPIGAVLAPLLEGLDKMSDLPKASSLCGACEEVCPVGIPIPDMLLALRGEAQPQAGDPPWQAYSRLARSPQLWRMAMQASAAGRHVPNPWLAAWSVDRSLPDERFDFREWWRER